MSESESRPVSQSLISGVSAARFPRLFAKIVAQSHDAIVVCDADGMITHWNRPASELYGYTAAEAIGRSPDFLVPAGHEQRVWESSVGASRGQDFQQYLSTRRRKDGHLIEVSLTISPVLSDAGKVLGAVTVARDISATMRIQSRLTEIERRMNEAQALAHVGSWDWDLLLEVPTWTEELFRIYGYPLDHVPSGEDLFSRVHADDRDMVIEKVGEARTGIDNAVSYRIELPDGELRYVEARHQARLDEEGAPVEVHGIVQDATERQHQRAELARLATHDSLTGLPNRRTFDERFVLELARARRAGMPLSLAVIDIDKFKRINDTFGHQVGDRVLARAGELFAAQVRDDELLARVGGEEFAWIMHDAPAEGSWLAVERARTLIGSEVFDEVGKVTISAGICTLGPGMDQDELYRAADLALLEAKRSGRDRVVMVQEAAAPVEVDGKVAARRVTAPPDLNARVKVGRGSVRR